MQQSQSNILSLAPHGNHVLAAVTSREIVAGNRFGRKTQLNLLSIFSSEMYTKLARIKK